MSYTYDAWGNASVTYHTSTETFQMVCAMGNPIKYRGYYYDSDLELYCLGTRYYDSVTGRFVSPDSIMADVGGVSGYNSDVKIGEVKDKNDTTKGMDNNSEICNLPETEKSITDESKKLTKKDRIKNAIIGAGLGVAVAGGLIATGGAVVGTMHGVGAAYLGVNALQGFAAGALALDSVAFFIMPLFCIDIEPIEYETPTSPTIP